MLSGGLIISMQGQRSVELVLFHAAYFLSLELAKAWQELVPLDAMGVKFGTIDAGMLTQGLAVLEDRHHAGNRTCRWHPP